ncbi:methyltransferase domain-containing protein [Chamaesiphon sp. VAR_48_metabat_403]|uniref:class I SAM-dependent methyltransferase n=1 Tax=Chamaesiphon sp. VAR_48_metabat_403 TaxID=2964700 RepID=UPI00286DAF64|nr:methyltransferase domain-containing protein [Chamaesiphon sp. VAR_48_metabat_403]
MKEAIKQSLSNTSVYDLARSVANIVKSLNYQLVRKFGSVDRQIVANYFQENEIRKLHIGCGGNMLPGWLNSDLKPFSPNIFNLDATKPFPLENDRFDCVFSEHMIEHISYADGLLMLTSCFHALKPQGKIRISTPNLPFLIDLYKEGKSSQQHEYIKWATHEFVPHVDAYHDTFVINNFVRDWGHQFIYDEKTLRLSLERAGFTNIVKCNLNDSNIDSFKNLENESRLPAGFLKLETLTLEATKLINS